MRKPFTPHLAILAILLLTLLLGTTSAFADTCNDDSHKWGSAGTSMHTCSVCGARAPHTKVLTSNGVSGHTITCTDCDLSLTGSHTLGVSSKGDFGHVLTCSDGCGYSVTNSHVWNTMVINVGANHYLECGTCGMMATQPHTFGAWYSLNEDMHQRACTANGCTALETLSHSFTYSSNGSQHTATCSGCGYSYSESHSLPSTYINDSANNQHYRRCTLCNAADRKAHTWGSWVNVEGSNAHQRTCTANGCGAVETAKHTYVWQEASTPGYHVQYCTTCGDYSNTGKCSGGTATCTAKATCTTCGLAYGEKGNHTWGSWASAGSSMHAHTCSVCGETDRAAHNITYTANGTQHTVGCTDCNLNLSEAHDLGDSYTNAGDQHTRTCSKCKATDRKAHTWGSWVNVEGTNAHQRTCTANGCGAVETAKHTYVWQAASTPGYHVQYCATCGDYSNTGKCSGGTANCVTLAVCSTCGLSYGSNGSHSMSYWLIVDDSIHMRECTNDGCSYSETASHTFDAWFYGGPDYHQRNCSASECSAIERQPHNLVVISSDESTHTLACSVCGTASTTSNHTWGEWVTTDPTCYEDGSKTRTCSVCSKTQTETIACTGHLGGFWTYPSPDATCGADGVEVTICRQCGDITTTKPISATGNHTWGEWKADNENTHTHTCSICSATESDRHRWQVISVTPATCISRQVTHSECTVCGAGSHATSGGYADHTLGAWEISSSSAHVRYCSTEGCTYTETAGHTLTDWTAKDNITHSRYCTAGCGYTEYENHYGGTATCCSKAECVICGRPYGDTASTHNWQLESSTTGNCVTVATQTYRCPDCQRTEVRNGAVNPTVHTGNVTVKTVLAPTCTSKGMNEVYCADCNALLYTDLIDIVPHEEGEPVIDPEPTCCDKGLQSWYCVKCNTLLRTEVLPALGHKDGEYKWVTTKEPTCTEEGEEKKVCAHSGKDLGETHTIPALGHDMTGDPVVTPATCTAEGSSVTTCQRPGCTHSETTILPILDHVEGEPVIDPEPTCCDKGLQSWYCVNCNTLLRTEELDPLGHDANFKWVTVTEPTCTEEGLEKKVCAHSGKDLGETRTIPALGHIYVGLWEVGESDTHHRDCYRCGAGRRNVECTYLPLIIDDVEYQVCPVCGRFHNQKLEVVAEADITIVTGSKPGVSLVRMLADPFGADEIRYPAIMTAIFEAEGYIADPDQNVTGITVILPVDAMASFKLVFVHMDDATGELVWTDVPYTLENGILTFAVEEMGLFLFVAE